jgi:cytochrome c-type biogenesis protein CcmE
MERREKRKYNIAYVIMCCVHLFVYIVLYDFTQCVKPKSVFFVIYNNIYHVLHKMK